MPQVIANRFRISRRALLKGLSLSGAPICVGLPPLVSMFNAAGTAYAAEASPIGEEQAIEKLQRERRFMDSVEPPQIVVMPFRYEVYSTTVDELFDALGRILNNSKLGSYTYDVNHPHAVAQAGSDTFTYDANGLMLSGAGRTLFASLGWQGVSVGLCAFC